MCPDPWRPWNLLCFSQSETVVNYEYAMKRISSTKAGPSEPLDPLWKVALSEWVDPLFSRRGTPLPKYA